jgi:hypothetical protein
MTDETQVPAAPATPTVSVAEKHSLLDEVKDKLKEMFDWAEGEWGYIEAMFEGKKEQVAQDAATDAPAQDAQQ